MTVQEKLGFEIYEELCRKEEQRRGLWKLEIWGRDAW